MDARFRRSTHAAVLALAALALASCASDDSLPYDFLVEQDPALVETTPLGGEALSQRKAELERAHRDLIHFYATLEGLRHRRERGGLNLFAHFVAAYMGRHLEPMLRNEWQSEHPELMGIDANVRFAQAEVLLMMREPRYLQRVVDEIARRYAGRENMLVDYPIGGQSTLQEALDTLTERKWRG